MNVGNTTVLVDRSWVHQLALPGQSKSAIVREILNPYELIAVETGGASAFYATLEQQAWLSGKLYAVGGKDLEAITGTVEAAIARQIEKLRGDERVKHAYRIYVARSGKMADDLERVLAYLYRLICLSRALRADIFLSENRIGIFEAVLGCHGIAIEPLASGNCAGGTAALNLDILPAVPGESSAVRFFTAAPAGERRTEGETAGEEETATRGRIFISYFHVNRDQVRALREALVAAGERVWWDQDILPGQDWSYEIREALRSASACVMCFSKEADGRAESGVYPEALDAIAMYRERRPGSIFLIPVRLSRCSIPHIEIDATRTLDRIQYIDLFPPEVLADNIGRLLQALRAAR